MPASSGTLHNVFRREALSRLQVTEMNCVAVDDFDCCELLSANLRQVGAHRGDSGLNIWDGQRTRVARNRRAIYCERRCSGAASQQNYAATDAQSSRVHFKSNETKMSRRELERNTAFSTLISQAVNILVASARGRLGCLVRALLSMVQSLQPLRR